MTEQNHMDTYYHPKDLGKFVSQSNMWRQSRSDFLQENGLDTIGRHSGAVNRPININPISGHLQ